MSHISYNKAFTPTPISQEKIEIGVSSQSERGFTLIELMVSISIISVILLVVISNHGTYTENISLTNLADDIALSASQAQIYGIAVKEVSVGSSDFSASYGLTANLLSDGSNKAYLKFSDKNVDSVYNGDWSCQKGPSYECLEKVDILRGNYIYDLCVIRSSEGDQCNAVKRVDISYRRPNTSAIITAFNSGGQQYSPGNMVGVRILLRSPSGLSRSVAIYENGQVSVQ